MMALKTTASAVLRTAAAGITPAGYGTQTAGAASVFGLRKMSSIFSASAEPAASGELSSFGDTKISSLLQTKGDKGTWLWCTTGDTVLSAITKMSKANVGSLIVLEDGVADASGNVGHIRGIFTERDYLKKIVLEGRNSKETSITDIMTPKDVMLTIDPTHSVMEAMEMMVENQIRHLPVVDNDTLVGMVSIRDVVGTMVGEHKKSMEMMSNYINGTY